MRQQERKGLWRTGKERRDSGYEAETAHVTLRLGGVMLELADPCQHGNSIKLVEKLSWFFSFLILCVRSRLRFFFSFFLTHIVASFSPILLLNSETHLWRLPSTRSSEWSVLWLYMRSANYSASLPRNFLFPLFFSLATTYKHAWSFMLLIIKLLLNYFYGGMRIFMYTWIWWWAPNFDMFIALWCLYGSTLFMMGINGLRPTDWDTEPRGRAGRRTTSITLKREKIE